MPTIALRPDHTTSFNCFRHSTGYVTKGVILLKGKPVRVFEFHGATISAAEEAARAKAQEICRR